MFITQALPFFAIFTSSSFFPVRFGFRFGGPILLYRLDLLAVSPAWGTGLWCSCSIFLCGLDLLAVSPACGAAFWSSGSTPRCWLDLWRRCSTFLCGLDLLAVSPACWPCLRRCGSAPLCWLDLWRRCSTFLCGLDLLTVSPACGAGLWRSCSTPWCRLDLWRRCSTPRCWLNLRLYCPTTLLGPALSLLLMLLDLRSLLILLLPLHSYFLSLLWRSGLIALDAPVVSPTTRPIISIIPTPPVLLKSWLRDRLIVPRLSVPISVSVVSSPTRVYIIIKTGDIVIITPATVVIT
jgi:hypothetical protein